MWNTLSESNDIVPHLGSVSLLDLYDAKMSNRTHFQAFCGFNKTTETLCRISRQYPKFTAVVPYHWLEHGFIGKVDGTILAVCLSFLILISYSANTLWCIIYSRNASLQTPTNKMVTSLIMADILMMTKTWLLVVNSLAGGPLLGTVGCYCFASIGTQAGLVQIWTIAAISLERAKVIYRPFSSSRRLSRIQVTICIVFIWILAAMFSLAPMLGWNSFVSEAYFLGCSFNTWSREFWDRTYIFVLIVLGYLIPLMVICISYLAIYKCTQRSRKSVAKRMQDLSLACQRHMDVSTSSNIASSTFSYTSVKEKLRQSNSLISTDRYAEEFAQKTMETEKRLARMALFIIGIWTLTWTPYAITALLQEFGYGHLIHPAVSLTVLTLAKCSSIINTFIYGLRLPHFRKHIRRTFPRLNSSLPMFTGYTKNTPITIHGHYNRRVNGPPLNSRKRMLHLAQGNPSLEATLPPSSDPIVSQTQEHTRQIRIQEVQSIFELEQAKFEEWRLLIENRKPQPAKLQKPIRAPKKVIEELKADLRELIMHSSTPTI